MGVSNSLKKLKKDNWLVTLLSCWWLACCITISTNTNNSQEMKTPAKNLFIWKWNCRRILFFLAAQKIFQRAKEKAGIRKEVSFHSLRHSFATHLLEKGIDIRFIKDILGHFDIRTTERYAHVRKDQLINIVSPLDDLWLKGDIL